MGSATTAIDQLNWPDITAQLDIEGYALLPGLLAPEHARDLARHTDTLETLRRVSLASSDLGRGDLFCFDAGLPASWPRMQSRPMVLPLKLGDAAIISTAQRPFKGTKGFYRVNLKHAISRVRSGERIGVELSFHDTQ
jgi:hypothetical protein